jgi:hypothetical protein
MHAPLRHIFGKVREEHPEMDDPVARALANQALKDSFRIYGMCPTLLVFGIVPPLLETKRVFPSKADQAKAKITPRLEYEKMLVDLRVRRALARVPPSAADSNVSAGYMFYVYGEKSKNWAGPMRCVMRNGKGILVMDGRYIRSLNISQVNLAPIEDPVPQYDPSNDFVT